MGRVRINIHIHINYELSSTLRVLLTQSMYIKTKCPVYVSNTIINKRREILRSIYLGARNVKISDLCLAIKDMYVYEDGIIMMIFTVRLPCFEYV